MKIIRRLATMVPPDKLEFKMKDGTRTIGELLHYLSYIGTGTISYWYRTDGTDFRTFFTQLKTITPAYNRDEFGSIMDEQINLVNTLFAKITDDDLHAKIVDYPWGATAPLGEAIIETNIKWLTGYKLQLFTLIKQVSDQKMGTPDAWRHTEVSV